MTSGILYVLGTPIGNLGDLSVRATELLRNVAVVAAEDTRRTKKLLEVIQARPDRLMSYHAHSDSGRTEAILEILRDGRDVALTTDAGTPGVSDPGVTLVSAALDQGIKVVPIPGPSAVGVALSASGLSADRYLFLGFLPRKGRQRRERLAEVAASTRTVVIFEAANRLVALLKDLAAIVQEDRLAVVARELTKLHEEIRRGSVAELIAHYEVTDPRGEVTLVVAGGPEQVAVEIDFDAVRECARDWIEEGESRREVVRKVSAEFGLSRNDSYRLVMDLD